MVGNHLEKLIEKTIYIPDRLNKLIGYPEIDLIGLID